MSTKFLLRGLKRPKQVEFIINANEPGYARFVAEPFERGFGTTLGNSLRRTLNVIHTGNSGHSGTH